MRAEESFFPKLAGVNVLGGAAVVNAHTDTVFAILKQHFSDAEIAQTGSVISVLRSWTMLNPGRRKQIPDMSPCRALELAADGVRANAVAEGRPEIGLFAQRMRRTTGRLEAREDASISCGRRGESEHNEGPG